MQRFVLFFGLIVTGVTLAAYAHALSLQTHWTAERDRRVLEAESIGQVYLNQCSERLIQAGCEPKPARLAQRRSVHTTAAFTQ